MLSSKGCLEDTSAKDKERENSKLLKSPFSRISSCDNYFWYCKHSQHSYTFLDANVSLIIDVVDIREFLASQQPFPFLIILQFSLDTVWQGWNLGPSINKRCACPDTNWPMQIFLPGIQVMDKRKEPRMVASESCTCSSLIALGSWDCSCSGWGWLHHLWGWLGPASLKPCSLFPNDSVMFPVTSFHKLRKAVCWKIWTNTTAITSSHFLVIRRATWALAPARGWGTKAL